MIFRHLWERDLFLQLLKILFFTWISFYILYILMDYSLHSHHFLSNVDLTYKDLVTYYFYLLMKRADIILPLAFAIAVNKVLLSLNQSHAMIALLVGGLKKLTLLRPFFLTALLLGGLLLINFEYIVPKALHYLNTFEYQNFKKLSSYNYSKPSAYSVALGKGERLIFSSYDAQEKVFHDVYYIQQPDHLWKMKSLKLQSVGSEGYYVESIERDAQHLLVKTTSYSTLLFPHLSIDLAFHQKKETPLEQKSLSALYQMLHDKVWTPGMSAAGTLTHLSFKLSVPFVSCLILIAAAPFCMMFSRKLPIFMIYSMSIFGIVVFFIIMDALVIISENKIAHPYIIMSSPYLIFLLYFYRKFKKHCLD